MKHNFRASFYGHFNCMRTFVLNEESALLMATYPQGPAAAGRSRTRAR